MKLEVKDDLKSRFYELRALHGKSYDSIAQELSVSKPTLIKWEREAKEILGILQGFRVREVVASYQFGIENRLTGLIEIAQKIRDELLGRDLVEVPSNKLTEMLATVLESIREIELDHLIRSAEFDTFDGSVRNFFTKV